MQPIINPWNENAEASLAWLGQFLHRYDMSAIQSLRIDCGNRRYEGVYGNCRYPTKKYPMFRISCHAPGPFPCTTVTRKPPLYPRDNGTFPRAPRGCRRGALCHDPNTGRQWYRVVGKTRLQNLDEAVVWIVAHEVFHFLRRSRQISGRDNEIEADRFADDTLCQFQERDSTMIYRKQISPQLPLFG